MDIYSFDNVTMLVDQRPITGYAEGSTIKIEDNEDSILPKVGLDGSVPQRERNGRPGALSENLRKPLREQGPNVNPAPGSTGGAARERRYAR